MVRNVKYESLWDNLGMSDINEYIKLILKDNKFQETNLDRVLELPAGVLTGAQLSLVPLLLTLHNLTAAVLTRVYLLHRQMRKKGDEVGFKQTQHNVSIILSLVKSHQKCWYTSSHNLLVVGLYSSAIRDISSFWNWHLVKHNFINEEMYVLILNHSKIKYYAKCNYS